MAIEPAHMAPYLTEVSDSDQLDVGADRSRSEPKQARRRAFEEVRDRFRSLEGAMGRLWNRMVTTP